MHVEAMASGVSPFHKPYSVSWPCGQGLQPLAGILLVCFIHKDIPPRMVVCAESFYNLGSLSFSKPVCIPKGKLSTPLLRLSVITWETLKSPNLKRCSRRRVKDEKKPGWEIKEVGAE